MRTDKIVLHAVPGDEPGSMRFHPAPHFDGGPPHIYELRMKTLNGAVVRDVSVHFVFSHRDDHGFAHYRTRTNYDQGPTATSARINAASTMPAAR